MKKLLVLGAALLLVGCEPTFEEKERVRSQLPAGCSIKDLGSYGDIRKLVVVSCDGRASRTIHMRLPAGKTHRLDTIAQIGDL